MLFVSHWLRVDDANWNWSKSAVKQRFHRNHCTNWLWLVWRYIINASNTITPKLYEFSICKSICPRAKAIFHGYFAFINQLWEHRKFTFRFAEVKSMRCFFEQSHPCDSPLCLSLPQRNAISGVGSFQTKTATLILRLLVSFKEIHSKRPLWAKFTPSSWTGRKWKICN